MTAAARDWCLIGDDGGPDSGSVCGFIPNADGEALPCEEDGVYSLLRAGVLRPTQGPPDRPGARQLGPDGRYEHAPLRFVLLEEGDLDAVAGAAQLLGRHVVLRPHSELAEGAAAAAAWAGLASGRDVVELLARLHGALDLEWTADAELLHARVAAAHVAAGEADAGPAVAGPAGAGGDVVFTVAEEAAYGRLVDRFNGMWAASDPLARWTY